MYVLKQDKHEITTRTGSGEIHTDGYTQGINAPATATFLDQDTIRTRHLRSLAPRKAACLFTQVRKIRRRVSILHAV